jgi:hypothetical protein
MRGERGRERAELTYNRVGKTQVWISGVPILPRNATFRMDVKDDLLSRDKYL